MEQPSAVPNVFELGWQAESDQTFEEWAAENIRLRDSPYGNHFLLEETPWLKEPIETVLDPAVEETVSNSAAQCSKTVMLLVLLIYVLRRQPGETMFVAQTIDEIKAVARGKILPMIEGCPGLAAQLPAGNQRHNRSLRSIQFPNCTLHMGPANENFLRGKTIRWVFGDECSNWAPGKMDQARARTTRVWNRKHFFSSTPLEANSDFDRAFRDGHQARYHLAAPCCGELVYLTSENLEKLFEVHHGGTEVLAGRATEENKNGARVERAPTTFQELVQLGLKGEIDWTALKRSVRLVCPKCGAKHDQVSGIDEKGTVLYDTALYRKMIAGARYVPANPNAAREKRSFAFNVFILPPEVFGWGKIVELWIKAKIEEARGNLAPLKEFVTLRLAESWDERKFLSFSLPNFEAYDPTAEFPKEMFRALTVDCQEHLAEFHCVVRSWDVDGGSRLLTAATVHTESEIEALRIQWKVKPWLTGLDCGYERYRVFDMCLRHGWTAMGGEDRREWSHELQGATDGRRVNRPYSPLLRGDPRNGRIVDGKNWCMLYNWSNPQIKDLLWMLKEGRGAPWAVCDLGAEMSDRYGKWLDSERKREEIDKFGRVRLIWKKIRQNHFWDAECMQVVFASIAKLFIFSGGDERGNHHGGAEGTEKKGGLSGEKDAEGRAVYEVKAT